MRIAAFNVENLFDRAKAFEEPPSISSAIQKDMAELNSLFEQVSYSAADKQRMIALISALGLRKSDTGPFVILRVLRGKLLKRPQQGPIEIVADGRDDWVGMGRAEDRTCQCSRHHEHGPCDPRYRRRYPRRDRS